MTTNQTTKPGTMKLGELAGEVEYRLSSGGTGSAHMSGRVRFPHPEDMSYPHPFRPAWNGKIFLSVTQAAIDRGDWWPARGEAEFQWNDADRYAEYLRKGA